jgi:hypothetical protein
MRVISDKERKQIGEFFVHIRDTARQNFERDAFCEPVGILLRDGKNAILPLRKLINHKDAAAAVLNKVIEAVQPLAFVFVTEAWMASAYELPKNADGGLADIEKKYHGSLTDAKHKPKKGVKEVVMLQCSSVVGDNFMLTADIVRAEGVKPVLKQWVRMENTRAEGRFIFDVTPLTERQ